MNRYSANRNAAYSASISGRIVQLLNNIRTADQTALADFRYMLGLPPEFQSVPGCGSIPEGKFSGSCISVNFGTIHQLRARRGDDKVARNLHANRILERNIAVEVIQEEDRAPVAKLTRTIPIAPAIHGVVQIQVADAFELLSARGNRIFQHQVTRFVTGESQLNDEQVAGVDLARQRSHGPLQF